jgi:hypothetical protein
VTLDSSTTATAATPIEARGRLRWWREVLYIAAFYGIYSAVRNTFGSAGGVGRASVDIAFNHAKAVIAIQDAVGLWFEPELQDWYLGLPAHGGIRFWNIYYGTAHFVLTVVALVWMFRRQPERYPVWRNTLAAMTALALIGFASFSLMPPRLLDDTSVYGACRGREKACHGYQVTDTLAVHGGLWSFDSGAMAKVSNQFAAMPSMHTGWSTWCAIVLWPLVRRRWVRALVVAYPLATVFCILITGNHYWLDAAGGLAALGAGWLIGSRLAAFTSKSARSLSKTDSRRAQNGGVASQRTGGPW